MKINKQWLLKSRPIDTLSVENFQWHEQAIPELKDGEVLVRHLYLSLDPTNRIWTNSWDSYLPPVKIGEVMRGIGIGVVEASRHSKFKPGDFVQGLLNWQTHMLTHGDQLARLNVAEGVPLTTYHGLLGMIGMTAYFGLMDIGQPKPGETLVVSAAAGAVGSLVGQIGKLEGCRVVGIAGSDDKCRWLVDELGFDAAINYKTGDLEQQLEAQCPEGIDIYFDNVGGDILNIMLAHLNIGARIPLCGMISTYNDKELRPGPSNIGALLMKRALIKGFIVSDYFDRAKEAGEYLLNAYKNDQLKFRLEMHDGLENAPHVFGKLFDGSNTGKLVLKVDPDWREA
ncbi:NADP-dependent oxidoreductase [Parahaliea maris]|uniref:NADP-dependent oxidoreductase n=1 Tax=Parahaliea maris TaxID=2716870 RepID=A0A5C9A321_9GAMM|nr:NADP-dependent oxidoreductase [Parahaliea maris]TXS95273.1 NADP-dependent oxidoreductase [Parahaliea maris]